MVVSGESEWSAGGVRSLRSVWAWLRRGERAASLESLSSAGSARTAASFSFVSPPPRALSAAPAEPRRRAPAPRLPLYVKYGLPQDTSTLPPPRRRSGRSARPARRAASEYGVRHAAHVPGKRRAPPPPAPPVTAATVAPLRRAHKRPAPRPPSFVSDRDDSATLATRAEPKPAIMDSSQKTRLSEDDESPNTERGVKSRPEKSFLRQMFENKFRNSLVETVPARVLPSISELDREAAAIIRNNRERNKRENEANAFNIYTQTDDDVYKDRLNKIEEKEKLKEMLKEIKKSLPKKPKHSNDDVEKAQVSKDLRNAARQKFFSEGKSSETPTLPIGAKDISKCAKVAPNQQFSQATKNVTTNPILVTHQIIVMDSMAKESIKSNPKSDGLIQNENLKFTENNKRTNVYQPMKVSALFNPIYIPKNKNPTEKTIYNQKYNVTSQSSSKSNATNHTSAISSRIIIPDIVRDTDSGNNCQKKLTNINEPASLIKQTTTVESNTTDVRNSANKVPSFNVDVMSQHLRRRDLINQLEQSIAKGDEKAAAEAAIKLAQLRLSCSVLSFSSKIINEPSTSKADSDLKTKYPKPSGTLNETQLSSGLQNVNGAVKSTEEIQHDQPTAGPSTSRNRDMPSINKNEVSIQVWIEDKETTRGPIPLTVSYKATLKDLKQQAEATLGLAARLQRWIVGNSLCNDDDKSLSKLAGPEYKAPFYLCLVESESTHHIIEKSNDKQQGEVYLELMKLEQCALIPNSDIFECDICMDHCKVGEGVILRECVHTFCKNCLRDVVRHSEEHIVRCPATDCLGLLQEREVRALVSADDYERWLARSLAAAESSTRNAFHCRTPDCKGWALCEANVTKFPCPICKKTNCVKCQVIHDGQTCDEYRAKLEVAKTAIEGNQTDEGTKALLESLVGRGEALECPECRVIIIKKWGCDWIKCSACKTEICWVTRGRRWGPGGRGDTSAGCRCGEAGRRCHPACGYCH